MQARRGDIFFVEFDPVQGSEQGGRRPALVIQNDVANKLSPVLIVASITSNLRSRRRPTNVELDENEGGLEFRSMVLLNQIRTIDRGRLRRYVGRLGPSRMAVVDEAIRISLGVSEEFSDSNRQEDHDGV